MKAEKHFQVGAEFAQEQADLDLATKWRSVVVDCHMAAHHFILAGAERRGIEHANKHAHGADPKLLVQAQAPDQVSTAWDNLEALRTGRTYGGKTNGGAAMFARACLKTIRAWAESASE